MKMKWQRLASLRFFLEIDSIYQEISDWLVRSRYSEIVTDGFKVVVLGPPNAGKSSLLNVLAGREAAIVTDEPGQRVI